VREIERESERARERVRERELSSDKIQLRCSFFQFVLVLEHKVNGFTVFRYHRIGYRYRTGETHFL